MQGICRKGAQRVNKDAVQFHSVPSIARQCTSRSTSYQPCSSTAEASQEASTSGRHLPDFQSDSVVCGARTSRSRRQLLSAICTVVPVIAAGSIPTASAAAEAAGATCQLQSSSTGLQWCDVKVGEGQLPIKGAFTKLNYTAKLASTGAVFDSTYQRRQPLIFKVGECEMVQAFDVAILGAEDIPPMREGGQRLVVAPPGPMQRQGVKSLTWVTGLLDAIEEAGEPISPEGGFNSTLVFELELVPKRRG